MTASHALACSRRGTPGAKRPPAREFIPSPAGFKIVRSFLNISILFLLLPFPTLAQPPDQLPDLDVLYIERTPRYPGYALDYDRPGQEGVPIPVDNKTRQPLTPAQAKTVQRWPAPGETVTFIAHVQNRGRAPAPGWEYAWYVDGREKARGQTRAVHPPGQEMTINWTWKWQPGRHTIRFVVDPLYKVRDLSLHNNAREDATDAWSLLWAVDRVTYESFNRVRNFLGTNSFEDWAQWHVDHMNHLFDISPLPKGFRVRGSGFRPNTEHRAPNTGWTPRVRCDRIVVVEDTGKVWESVLGPGVQPLDAGYDGGWVFGRREECAEWAANVDWGLIHEWGHQLGLTDEYALDRPGFQNLVPDENGDPLLIAHRSSMWGYMMHGHGPTTFSPICMGALMTQQGKRRGYYGDYYYCIPKINRLRILDRMGRPVPGAKVTFWQDRENEYRGAPVFSGVTDREGLFTMPNRPAPPITTETGYTQRDNPFGKINVVGPGDVFFIRIQARGHTEYVWMDIAEFNLAYLCGHTDRAVYTRKTYIPPPGAPPAPKGLRAEVHRDRVTLTWHAVPGAKGYRIYHGAPDLYEYGPVAEVKDALTYTGTLGSGALHRYAVTAIGADGKESAFSGAAGAMHFVRPWGIAVTKDGRRLIRDAAYGQAVLQKPDGNTVGPVGSVHHHFEGSYDLALDSKGRILSAKWGDGYDPNPGFRVQDANLNLVVDYRQPEGSEPGRVRRPMGIGANSKDHIFLADTGNDRVQEFTPDGKFVRVIGEGELDQPMKVAFDRQDRLYVADSGSNRIVIYAPDAQGNYKMEKALSGAIKEPVYVLVDERGRVFVSTNRVAGVYMYDETGQLAWKYQGTPDAPLTGPRGLALDGRGNLLIVDEATRRVWTVKAP